jgi:hypothetical protein
MKERILLIANETVDADEVHDVLRQRAAEVLVIVPALNGRLRHWLSDEDEARRAAAVRLGRCLQRFADAGISARGWVGDADPMLAIADGLHFFEADEIVIATHAPGRSHWLERDLVRRVRMRYPHRVRHVAVGGCELRAA